MRDGRYTDVSLISNRPLHFFLDELDSDDMYSNWLSNRHHIHESNSRKSVPLSGCFCVTCDLGDDNLRRLVAPKFVKPEEWYRKARLQSNVFINRGSTDPVGLMELIMVPYVFDAGKRVDRGYVCLACDRKYDRKYDQNYVQNSDQNSKRPFIDRLKNRYTRRDILAHIAECEPLAGV